MRRATARRAMPTQVKPGMTQTSIEPVKHDIHVWQSAVIICCSRLELTLFTYMRYRFSRIVQGADWHFGPTNTNPQPEYIRDAALATFLFAMLFFFAYLTFQVGMVRTIHAYYLVYHRNCHGKAGQDINSALLVLVHEGNLVNGRG